MLLKLIYIFILLSSISVISCASLAMQDKFSRIYKLFRFNYPENKQDFYVEKIILGSCRCEHLFDSVENYNNYLKEINNDSNFSDLMIAANELNSFKVCLLCLSDVNINTRSNLGYTALMIAVIHGCKDIFNSVLKFEGIDINLQNYSGKTAIMIAVELGNELFIKILKDKGSNLSLKDSDGLNVQQIAKRISSDYIISLLEEESDICAICVETIKKDTSNWQLLACGHIFDNDCIFTWKATCRRQRKVFSCPICRFVIK